MDGEEPMIFGDDVHGVHNVHFVHSQRGAFEDAKTTQDGMTLEIFR